MALTPQKHYMLVYSVSIFLSEPVKSRGTHIPTQTEKSSQLKMDSVNLFVGLFGTLLIGFGELNQFI